MDDANELRISVIHAISFLEVEDLLGRLLDHREITPEQARLVLEPVTVERLAFAACLVNDHFEALVVPVPRKMFVDYFLAMMRDSGDVDDFHSIWPLYYLNRVMPVGDVLSIFEQCIERCEDDELEAVATYIVPRLIDYFGPPDAIRNQFASNSRAIAAIDAYLSRPWS
jgi:hypothetical protein